MSRDSRGSDGATEPTPTIPSTWRGHEFDQAPTEEQLRKISADEQRVKTLKTQSGQQSASMSEVVQSIKLEDFTSFHKAPCTREGLLTGIGGGAAMGALRYILRGGPTSKSANWAAGSFIAFAVGSYEYCQYLRRVERENMKRVVEVHNQKQQALRRQAEEAKKAEDKKAGEVAAAQKKSWYRFW